MNARQRKLIASLSASKLADLLISAKTTLPALLLAAGAPAWMLGWLVPIRESGALLPQAPLGVLLRRLPARHRVWRVGMHVQILSVLGIAAAALFLEGATAGWCMLAALVLLSLGRSACSLSMKDIQADIVEQGERGKLLGVASTISGILTLAIAVPLTFMGEDLGNKVASGITLFAAGAFTVGLVILYANHTRVETEEDGSSGFNWRFDSTVYRFILVRGLFVHSALLAPYFMVQSEQDAMQLLPYFLAAQALATMLSSFVWGSVADKSARLTLQLAGGLALLACALLNWLPEHNVYTAGFSFFVLAVAHTGVRTGRKTYSLDVKEGQDRTELVAFSNTAIGIILLGFGALYAMLSATTELNIVAIMSGALTAGMLLTLILPSEK